MISSVVSSVSPRSAAARAPVQEPSRLRPLSASDVEPIASILAANGTIFSDVEVRTAVEMLRQGLAQRPDAEDPYLFIVAEDRTGVVGFACYGSVPLTRGTFDLYWLAVNPARHGSGIGARILRAVEDAVRERGGHLLVVETSSRPDYAPTRAFYDRKGYDTVGWIKDFYRRGDDKVIYVKRLA